MQEGCLEKVSLTIPALTDPSFFLLCPMHSVMGVYLGFTSFALPLCFYHGIHGYCLLQIPALVYKSHLCKMEKKSKYTHRHKKYTNKEQNLFFEQKSMLCCVACEWLVSVVFDFENSPPIFFLKPSSLLGSATVNGKMIGEDKTIPLTATQKIFFKKVFFINLGQLRP